MFNSMKFAINGIANCIKTERNFRIHIVIFFALLISAKFYDFTITEMSLLIFASSLVMVAEMFNTAVEFAIDTHEQQHSQLAKLSKDISAGAVLLSCVFSSSIGVFLFWNTEKIWKLINLVVYSPLNIAILFSYIIVSIIFVRMNYQKEEYK